MEISKMRAIEHFRIDLKQLLAKKELTFLRKLFFNDRQFISMMIALILLQSFMSAPELLKRNLENI